MKKVSIICILLVVFIGIVTAFSAIMLPCPKWVKKNSWPPEDIILIVTYPGLGDLKIDLPKDVFSCESYRAGWLTIKDYELLLKMPKDKPENEVIYDTIYYENPKEVIGVGSEEKKTLHQ